MARYIKHILSFLFFAVNSLLTAGQSCPANIDFESGTLNNWECKTGRVDDLAGVNTITWQGIGVNTLNHKIIPRATAGTDQYGGFSEASPNGSAYSVRLGNSFFQSVSAESMSYTFSIPDTAQFFSILFYYAVVFQDPQHNPQEQPRFRSSLYNVTDNELITCSNFDFTASASLPGFQVSALDPSVIYKDWTPVTLNLSRYAGKTIRLEFITSDCTYKGHFGYAYIDVNSSCSGAIKGDVICPDASSAILTAPHGFQTYTWYSDDSYSTVLANTQTLSLSPAPPAGASFPVVVGPYPGFGCPDTIKSLMKVAGRPVANAGPDVSTCGGAPAQLGDVSIEGNSYNWQPASMLANTAGAAATTVPGILLPTSFYLEVTNTETGCKNYDTVLVTSVLLDTAMRLTGDTVFCMNKPANTLLQALDAGAAVQWYENGIAISGATATVYNPQPAATSVYWATLQKGQCLGSTRMVTVKKMPLPKAAFEITPAEQCINGPFQFTNKSEVPVNATNTYGWKISDGRTTLDNNMNLSFAAAGNYTVSLLAVSSDGCRDSITQSLRVIKECGVWVPTAFTPGDDGKNDLFRPYFYGAPKLKQFTVYDRNGFIVFTTKTLGEGWNGRHKGVAVPSGVLIWTLEYETMDGQLVFEKGKVVVIR